MSEGNTHEDKMLAMIQSSKSLREKIAPMLFDFYNANVEAGFDKDQALQLTGTWLTSIVSLSKGDQNNGY